MACKRIVVITPGPCFRARGMGAKHEILGKDRHFALTGVSIGVYSGHSSMTNLQSKSSLDQFQDLDSGRNLSLRYALRCV